MKKIMLAMAMLMCAMIPAYAATINDLVGEAWTDNGETFGAMEYLLGFDTDSTGTGGYVLENTQVVDGEECSLGILLKFGFQWERAGDAILGIINNSTYRYELLYLIIDGESITLTPEKEAFLLDQIEEEFAEFKEEILQTDYFLLEDVNVAPDGESFSCYNNLEWKNVIFTKL